MLERYQSRTESALNSLDGVEKVQGLLSKYGQISVASVSDFEIYEEFEGLGLDHTLVRGFLSEMWARNDGRPFVLIMSGQLDARQLKNWKRATMRYPKFGQGILILQKH